MAEGLLFQPPPPSEIKVDGVAVGSGTNLHMAGVGSILVSAKVRGEAANKANLRLIVRMSQNPNMTPYAEYHSAYGANGTRQVQILGLQADRHYYFEARVQQKGAPLLSNPNRFDFWSERTPTAPTLLFPADNTTFAEGSPIQVNWTHNDPDKDAQSRAQIQLRATATVASPAGPITTHQHTGSVGEYSIPASSVRSNTNFEFRVRTSDIHRPAAYGAWSLWRSFYVIGTTMPPVPLQPIKDAAAGVDAPLNFYWKFRDPASGTQMKADFRYRVHGEGDWITVNGDVSPGLPAGAQQWTMPTGTFQPGYRYEWQVRTYETGSPGTPSAWSTSAFFRSILTPGSSVGANPWIGPTKVQGALGEGSYRVFAFDRGGKRVRGEIMPLDILRWNRVRDDISTATLITSGFGADCCDMLSELRTWVHEIVVFRDGVRVWEGPITRIAYHEDHMEFEARDVMAYVYRRIMRQGYNDSHQEREDAAGNDIFRHVGKRSVVDRAAIIIANALAYKDPNVLPWLTRFDFPDDAMQSRVVADWSKSAWEEIDSLAATGGLDYSVVGRRIVLHDTHRAVGLLPELRSKDFFTPPVITEYGMSAANVFGVTSNSGIYGWAAYPEDDWGGAGPIEQLASEYGESGAGAGAPETMTSEQRSNKEAVLRQQAARNIDGRWPAPLVVRIPDNSRLHPEANVGINQLVPGVFVPLRAQTICREFAQMQKIDSVSVEVTSSGEESVKVVMSPAPTGTIDPDAEEAATDE